MQNNKEIGKYFNRENDKLLNKAKKSHTIIFVSLFLFIGSTHFSVIAHAATSSGIKYSVTVTTLNVRSGASTRSRVIGRVHKGQSLSVKKRLSNGWYQISLNGKSGYVDGKYVQKITFYIKHAAIKSQPAKVTTRYTVTPTTLYVHSGASSHYRVIGKVHKGQSLSVKQRLSNGWYQISFNGKTGYVDGKNVKKTTILNPNPVKSQPAKVVVKYTVNASTLYVRSGASTRDRILGKVHKGQTLIVMKRLSNGWYQISLNGKTGFVDGRFVKKTTVQLKPASPKNQPAKETINYMVNAPTLNVYAGANTSNQVIGKLSLGQKLAVEKRLSNGWYQISFNGKTGYVCGSYVKVTKVPKPSKSTTQPKTPTFRVLNVPLIRQRPALPSGCEANALAMALAYYHVNVKNTTLANLMPRDRTPLSINRNGLIRVWGNPEVGFVGNPYGLGITINPNPLKKVLDHYRKGGLALYGKDFSVIQNYVNKGKPALVWFTINHKMPLMRYWRNSKGKTVFAPHPLHCIVVTGVDNKYVYFNDGESTRVSGKNVKLPRNQFIAIYNAMGKRALVVN